MAQQNIDFGTFPDDPSADAIRTAFSKVQNNFNQLFGANADTAVTSINRTPGAGVTVNFPTGNVVISANIACLNVSTTSLKMGRGADNTQSNVTITSSSQQLNIDIDPNLVQSNYFAAVGNNLSNFNGRLTANSNSQPNVTSLGTLTGLNVSGNASFTGANTAISNIANLHIPGGGAGYGLVTDGAGNLSWSAVATGNGTTGGTNTTVQFNDGGLFGGSANFIFNKTTNLLTLNGNITTNNIIANTLTGSYANGNSNISIISNGNVTITSTSNATLVVTNTGINVAGYLTATGNITGLNANLGNLASANYFSGDGGLLSNLQIGNATVSNANYSNFAGTIVSASQPNITSLGTLTGVNVNGTANVVDLNATGNAVITGNLVVQGNATYYNITSFNVEDPIISVGGGANGAPLTTNDGKDRGVELKYYTTTPVSAFMGWDTGNSEFAFGSNVSISAGELVTYNSLGNVRGLTWLGNIDGNFANFANSNLGNSANANFFIGRFYGIANASLVANTVVDNAQPNITSVGNLTSLLVTGNTTSGNFIGKLSNGNSNINVLADGNININAVGVSIATVTGTGINVAGAGNFTGNLSAAAHYGPLANGNSNVNIASANGNVVITSVGNSVLTVTGTGANITGTANITGNANVGNLNANIVNATYLKGDGSNITNLSVSAGSTILNGNSNVTIPASNGNINHYVNSNNIFIVTGTGANVSGTFNATGIITGNGNGLSSLVGANVTGTVANATYAVTAGTAYAVSAGNITGTVNLANYATTANAVAGANVSGTVANATYAITSGTANAVAAANITGTINLANYATTANSVAGANVSGTVANATYALSAGSATTAGTVTTAAQPNITSVGTLSSLVVTANITGGNANLGNLAKANFFQGDGGLLSNLTIAAGSSITNGNSNVIVTANGNVNTSVAGNANIIVITGTGANVNGTVNATGNINGANITGTHYGAGNNLSNIQGANVSGTVANATYSVTAGTAYAVSAGNITGTVNLANYATTANAVAGANVTGAVGFAGTANSVAGANVTGAVAFAGTANAVAGANVSGTVANATYAVTAGTAYAVSAGNITGTVNLANYATTANAVAAANITGTVNLANYATTANAVAGANVSGQVGFAATANSVAGANVTGTVSTATTAGTVTTAAQPNITSVGTLTSLGSSGNITGANIIANSYYIRSVTTGISAAGTVQGNATAITKEINVVSTVASGSGVVLPTAVAGMVIHITNTSANSLLVYPASGGTINTLSANAGYTQGSGATLTFIAPTTTQWYTGGGTYA